MTAPSLPEPLPRPHRATPGDVAETGRAVAPWHAEFDPAAGLLRRPLESPGYHTTLTAGPVHPTRESLYYAVAVLDAALPEGPKRARAVLRACLPLQELDAASPWYGTWPWFAEEPLARMAPPDLNWADFNGVSLLEILRDHPEALTPELTEGAVRAVRAAAECVRRRDTGPDYTNVAVLGAYVTLVGGELLGWPDLAAYGAARLRRLRDFTRALGSFAEYNSPRYGVITLTELGRLRAHVQDAAARADADELYRRAWAEAARAFHPGTRQWAGPHGRTYSTLLERRVLALFQRGLGEPDLFGVDVPFLWAARFPLPCPPELRRRFTRPVTRQDRHRYEAGRAPMVGTTWLTPAAALGTVTRGSLWDQRRPLLAHFGTPTAPAFARVRVLRDGHDFAAAQLLAAQETGRVLAAVVFDPAGGQRHLSLDRMRAGCTVARDLRLRWEFGGAAAGLRPNPPAPADEPVWRVELGDGLALTVRLLGAAFGAEPGRWEAGADGATAFVDWVLRSDAAPAVWDFTRMTTAWAAWTWELAVPGHAPEDWPQPVLRTADDRLEARWGPLALGFPPAPASPARHPELFRWEQPSANLSEPL